MPLPEAAEERPWYCRLLPQQDVKPLVGKRGDETTCVSHVKKKERPPRKVVALQSLLLSGTLSDSREEREDVSPTRAKTVSTYLRHNF